MPTTTLCDNGRAAAVSHEGSLLETVGRAYTSKVTASGRARIGGGGYRSTTRADSHRTGRVPIHM
ncbi:hypothetical protein E2C01_015864 [Portunus trituberculatus]|uniref:Uncharacterized protein n=1 Tax=Portunus trituberculatus TaxID=210409 RepID=A0A5B7DP12_PORTR|nr:hypothetical protein [Portunus trituberculatus]